MGVERSGGAGGGGFLSTIKSRFERLREAAYDRQNYSREEMILQEFAFLERDFGCAPPDIRRGAWASPGDPGSLSADPVGS